MLTGTRACNTAKHATEHPHVSRLLSQEALLCDKPCFKCCCGRCCCVCCCGPDDSPLRSKQAPEIVLDHPCSVHVASATPVKEFTP
jgi:hypothetical protein